MMFTVLDIVNFLMMFTVINGVDMLELKNKTFMMLFNLFDDVYGD